MRPSEDPLARLSQSLIALAAFYDRHPELVLKVLDAFRQGGLRDAAGQIAEPLDQHGTEKIVRGDPICILLPIGGLMPKANRSGALLRLAPRHKVWLTLGGSFLMGPNYLRFLRAVDETGTIREAGKVVGWSYRTCLNRIRRMEVILGSRVLETARGGPAGGGSRLSPEALRLVAIFGRWQEDVAEFTRRAFRKAVTR